MKKVKCIVSRNEVTVPLIKVNELTVWVLYEGKYIKRHKMKHHCK